ncbi:conserved membrane protein of unknown function [Burkholderia multivorans]
MQRMLDESRSRAWPADVTTSAFRILFFITVGVGGIVFWLAPHPPMNDLPQHAAQIATLHDLLLGQSPWDRLLRINLFTPYLLGYVLAVGLSFVMPVAAALKVLLTLSFYGFVAAYVALRKHFGGDERLDWLCMPGFFGFAYAYGFFSYLVAAPIGMFLLVTARDYAEQPSARRGTVLLLANIALFFCHGLMFVFINAIGGMFLLVRHGRNVRRLARAIWPYALLAALCGVYALSHREVDLAPMYPFSVLWNAAPWVRLFCAIIYPWGIAAQMWMVPVGALLYAAPFFMGARLTRNRMAFVPLAVVAIVWFCVPAFAMNTFFLFQRFAMFIFPFYALIFRDVVKGEVAQRSVNARALVSQALLAAVCIGFVGVQGARAVRFAEESADFDAVTAAVEPAQRGLMLVFDKRSPAADNPDLYDNFALWYQAEHRGLVDFNAAWFPPQIVRYRLDRMPAVGPSDVAPAPLSEHFDWRRYQGRSYRYFFVRHTSPIPEGLFANPDCRVVLLKSAGTWSLYERQSCRGG